MEFGVNSASVYNTVEVVVVVKEGGDGEHWSVGNCEKQNINIAQKFY